MASRQKKRKTKLNEKQVTDVRTCSTFMFQSGKIVSSSKRQEVCKKYSTIKWEGIIEKIQQGVE